MKKATKKESSATLTRTHILKRDWAHMSSEAINREIGWLRTRQREAESDVCDLTVKLAESRRRAEAVKADANALEQLVEGRR